MGVNGLTGDYSRGAAGFMIRDGAIAEPVAEITIAGNLWRCSAAFGQPMISVSSGVRRANCPGGQHDDRRGLNSLGIAVSASHICDKCLPRGDLPCAAPPPVAAVAALSLALAPGLADARAGDGGGRSEAGAAARGRPRHPPIPPRAPRSRCSAA